MAAMTPPPTLPEAPLRAGSPSSYEEANLTRSVPLGLTFAISVLFGFFGLIPAFFGEREAAQKPYLKKGSHLWAVLIGCSLAFMAVAIFSYFYLKLQAPAEPPIYLHNRGGELIASLRLLGG